MDIKVKTAAGNTLTALYTTHLTTASSTSVLVNLTYLAPNNPQWFLNVYGTAANPAQNPQTGLNWTTDALDGTGQLAYPAGTYTVWAESYMNGMMDNYLSGGASYTGKTVAQLRPLRLSPTP